MKIFQQMIFEQNSSAMRLIFILMNWLIDKKLSHLGFRKSISNCWKIHIHINSHSQHIIVWYEFWTGGIIEPFFFVDAADRTIIDDARYHDMIIQFFILKLQDIDMGDMWSQQDGAICHTIRKTSNFPFLIRIDRPDRAI